MLSCVSSELTKYDRCQSVISLRIDTHWRHFEDAIQANQCMGLAEIKGCQVRYFCVWKNEVLQFHEFYATCVYMKTN